MSVLSTQNLALTYGFRDIFSGVTVTLPAGARVGLVGPNGVGKTSLFRILAGLMPPSGGSLHLARGIRLGYLRQEAVEAFAQRHYTVWNEMLTVFSHLDELEASMREMEARMAAGDASEALLAAYGEAQEAFTHGGGYDYEARIRCTLEGLGFGPEQWDVPLEQLSGGQKTRALLARLLLEAPTLLILDEPTNHLDVTATAWLEGTLKQWEGAVLVASHDRYFLDQVADRIWEMTPYGIEEYRGNYSSYVHQRQERWQRNREIYEREMERLRDDLANVEKYIAWRKFDEAWGRLKRLGRELLAIEKYGLLGVQGKSWGEIGIRSQKIMELDEARERIKAIRPPPDRPPQIAMHLKVARHAGQIVLRTRDLEVGYDGVPLARVPDIQLERGERVALIGPNGAGKTTLLRTLLGELQPVSGEVEVSRLYKVAYFAQAHEALNPEHTVLAALLDYRNILLPEARNYLARYLFRGDDIYKPVKALSGGERARLALAILTLDHADLLLLDEPTNHLDIPAQEVLEEGLERYEGTILLVSHDRYLIDALATQIWELRDGVLEIYRGTYREMVERRERDADLERRVAAPPRSETKRGRKGRQPEPERPERRLADLEDRIAGVEAALAECEQQLDESSEVGDVPRLIELSRSYESTQAELERLMAEWEKVAELAR